MLEAYGKLLATLPFSETQPGITSLVIRAVDETEPLLEEHDLRAAPATPDGCITLARVHEHFDCRYEARAHWDAWTLEGGAWRRGPSPLEVNCFGEEYDNGAYQDAGHLRVDLGFAEQFIASDAPTGAARQGENARALHNWLRQIKTGLPIERLLLWSEEEDDFEAQLDAALANR